MSQDRANLNIQNILTPIAQLSDLWLDGMRKWIDVMAAFVPRVDDTTSAPGGAKPAHVVVQIFCDRPAEASVNLDQGIGDKDLVADPLTGNHLPPIKAGNITIKRDSNGNVRVNIRIDKSQPTGKYEGAIRASSDRQPVVGSIHVTIDPVDSQA